MIEAHLRTKIQPLFNKLGYLCVGYVTPNMITAIAFITGITSGVAIASNHLWCALGLLLFSGLCDVMDGTIARLSNNTQKIGAYIDLISDRMVEGAVILGFAFLYPQHYLAYILFFIAVMLHFSTFITAGALFANSGAKSMHHDHSFVERAEAFLVFALMLLFPDYIFSLLMIFNTIVFADGMARFYRVVCYH